MMSDLSFVLSPLSLANYALYVSKKTLFDQCCQTRFSFSTLYVFAESFHGYPPASLTCHSLELQSFL